jgi:prepilin-type N-terminal cleavage/methylation domain-containing protein
MSLQAKKLRLQRGALGGFTLLEMLIVIAIMLLLVIATLPRIKYALDESKVREGSRQLNSYFSMARSRAAATGRPCGLWMVTEKIGDPLATPGIFQSTQLYLAEVPPSYCGDFTDSRAYITDSMGNLATINNGPNWRINFTQADGSLMTLVQNGDTFRIRLDHKGPIYNGFRNPNDSLFYITSGPTVPPTANGIYNSMTNPSGGYQYEISRNPVRIGQPLTLPRGTAIDLSYSGFGNTGVDFYSANNFVLVLFAPDGRVNNVTYQTWNVASNSYLTISGEAGGTVHFLVGRPEKVLTASAAVPPGAATNMGDSNALWVSVARLTGSVVTTDNAYTENPVQLKFDNPNFDPMNPLFTDFVFSARKYAREQDVKGGR